MKKNLSYKEWVFLASVLGFLLTLATISWISCKGAEFALNSPKYLSKTIQIHIDGEVKKPGTYCFQDKASTKEILKKAKPTLYADLTGLSDAYTETTTLIVPKLAKIQISIERESEEPVILELPLESRVSDLKKLVEHTHEERDFFKSRRLLRHGEKIHFPGKKTNKK
ncbi:MAG TPA: hypothetical protein VLG44_01210 [Chlamydiales bacterium]|nr:hypothetical protein [Chlamydiales bacterium]